MRVEFSTSSLVTAEQYMRHADSNISDGLVALVLEYVRAGKVRVRDPKMYDGRADVMPTDEMSDDDHVEFARRARREA